MAVRSYQ